MEHIQLPRVLAVNVAKAQVAGKPGVRAQFVLNSGACEYARDRANQGRKACTFCAFHDRKPREQGILFEDALHMAGVARADGIELLMSGGSIFDPRQMPAELLGRMLQLVTESRVHGVLLESRPEFVTQDKLHFAMQKLSSLLGRSRTNLEVAIGLEVFDDEVRTKELGKGFSFNMFLAAAAQVAAIHQTPVAYLLTGLPMFDETSASHDLFRAALKIHEFTRLFGQVIPAYRYPTSSPFRICIESFFPVAGVTSVSAGAYLTPAFVARNARGIVEKYGLEVYVATSTEQLGVAHPLAAFRREFESFNESQSVEPLKEIERRGSK